MWPPFATLRPRRVCLATVYWFPTYLVCEQSDCDVEDGSARLDMAALKLREIFG